MIIDRFGGMAVGGAAIVLFAIASFEEPSLGQIGYYSADRSVLARAQSLSFSCPATPEVSSSRRSTAIGVFEESACATGFTNSSEGPNSACAWHTSYLRPDEIVFSAAATAEDLTPACAGSGYGATRSYLQTGIHIDHDFDWVLELKSNVEGGPRASVTLTVALTGTGATLSSGNYDPQYGTLIKKIRIAGHRAADAAVGLEITFVANAGGNGTSTLNADAWVRFTPGCPCEADFDASGGTPDIADVDSFVGDWLAGRNTADIDCSGDTPDVGDLAMFFQQWLAGGCG